jgi:hypothetical protein
LIADVAIGAAIYSMRALCRSVLLLASMSSCGDPLDARKPLSAFFV